MVPKITSAGRSFKGAARYYLHDKQANTSERVAFVETMNLPTNDPRRAVAHMIDTATHGPELKKAAGLKGGRPLQAPVYTFSLAWHPSEVPTQEDQIDAAREALRALGMDDRQAVIVGHQDAAHPHVHVMVNRVCSKTGRAVSNSNDRLKLSQWAEDYERRQGQERCPERRKNNAARKAGQWRKGRSDSRPVWLAWKKAQTAELWNEHRAATDTMKPARKNELEALWQQKERRFGTRRAEIKALYRPIWRDVIKRQKAALKAFDAGLHVRLSYALSRPQGRIVGALQAIFAVGDLRHRFIVDQKAERVAISIQQRRTIHEAGREVTRAYTRDRDVLRAVHRAEDQARKDDTQDKTRQIWQSKPPVAERISNDFDRTADRPRQENLPERQRVANASEPERKPARRPLSDQVKDGRERSKNRSRSRTRKPS